MLLCFYIWAINLVSAIKRWHVTIRTWETNRHSIRNNYEIVDGQKDRQPYCVPVRTCHATAVLMMGTTRFGRHEDLIHVQHNDGTGACINMSLASSLRGHKQDTTTAHVHTHCNYSGKRPYSGLTEKHNVQTSWETTMMIQIVCYYSDRWLMYTCHHERMYQHHHRHQTGTVGKVCLLTHKKTHKKKTHTNN